MKKFYLVLALLFALSACSVGKKCVVTDEGNVVSSYVWFFKNGKLKIAIATSIKLRRPRMIKKLWKMICWPWLKFIGCLAKGLPQKNDKV